MDADPPAQGVNIAGRMTVSALRSKFPDASELADINLIHTFVDRVEVQHNRLIVALKDEVLPHTEEIAATAEAPSPATTLQIAWQKPPSKRKREILLPVSSAKGVKPIQADTRATLVSAIAKARRWLDDLVSGRIKDLNEITSRENCSLRKVEMTLSLAFLAPGLVKAAIEGRLPHGLGMVRLYEPPAEWSLQFTKLGLLPP